MEYNHRDESSDEKSKSGGEAIELIREIFTSKEIGSKINLQRKLFPSTAEEYFTPTKHDKNKRKHTFLQGAPARIEKRGENKLMLPFQQSITTGTRWRKLWELEERNAQTSFWCSDLTNKEIISVLKKYKKERRLISCY